MPQRPSIAREFAATDFKLAYQVGHVKKIVPIVGLVALLTTPAFSQTLSGIAVGDNISAVKKLGLDPVAKNEMGPFVVMRWTLPDRNDLSVTAFRDSGEIVYVESNWGGQQSGAFSDYPGFTYGNTTLTDIRAKFRTNGFAYKERGAVAEVPDGVLFLNSFEVNEKPDLPAPFITKVSRKNLDPKNPAAAAKLDTIIIGSKRYLDVVWGEDKAYDSNYRKIDWP